jgi:hypothetical protein
MAAVNKRRFTDQMLERLRPPTSGRIELGDEVVPGLVLRVTTSGVKSFSVIYKVPGEGGVSATGRLLAGRQHRITLGQYPLLGLAQARERARELLGTVSEGRDPRPERREANLLRHTNTVETVARRFIEQDAKRTVASWQNIQRVLDLHVIPRLGGGTEVGDRRRQPAARPAQGATQVSARARPAPIRPRLGDHRRPARVAGQRLPSSLH